MIQSCFQLLALGAQNMCQIPAPHMWSVVCALGNSEGLIFLITLWSSWMSQISSWKSIVLAIYLDSENGQQQGVWRRMGVDRKWQLIIRHCERNCTGSDNLSCDNCLEKPQKKTRKDRLPQVALCVLHPWCGALISNCVLLFCTLWTWSYLFFLTATFSSCFTILQNANCQRLMPD